MKSNRRKRIFAIALFSILLTGCGKNEKRVQIVKDCTGTYLRISENDYLVCNSDILSTVDNETYVKVSYYEVNECNEMDNEIVCMMYHEHKGLVKVTSLN